MGKIHTRVLHKDSLTDHAHALPYGYTLGALYKPCKDMSGWHTHLYQHEGMTLETTPSQEGTDHIHESECGDTSGPVAVRMDAISEPIRTEVIQPRGREWAVVSETGHVLGVHQSAIDAAVQLEGFKRSG